MCRAEWFDDSLAAHSEINERLFCVPPRPREQCEQQPRAASPLDESSLLLLLPAFFTRRTTSGSGPALFGLWPKNDPLRETKSQWMVQALQVRAAEGTPVNCSDPLLLITLHSARSARLAAREQHWGGGQR